MESLKETNSDSLSNIELFNIGITTLYWTQSCEI